MCLCNDIYIYTTIYNTYNIYLCWYVVMWRFPKSWCYPLHHPSQHLVTWNPWWLGDSPLKKKPYRGTYSQHGTRTKILEDKWPLFWRFWPINWRSTIQKSCHVGSIHSMYMFLSINKYIYIYLLTDSELEPFLEKKTRFIHLAGFLLIWVRSAKISRS